MINDKLKCICIHVPKTSGTSIKNTLGGFNKKVGYHARPEKIRKTHPNKWKEYLKFTFVRNPYDRVYSIYSYYKMGKKKTLVNPNILPNTFEEFVLNLEVNLKKLGLNYNQTDFIGDDIDFIGKFENLQGDFDKLCDKLGVEKKKLRTDRKSNRKANYKEVYTEEMKKIVEKYFSRDIERFGYKF